MARLYNFAAKPKQHDLARSQGPYLCTGDDVYLFDAGSLPALGYNASSLFGVAHHEEAWSDNKTTDNWRSICAAYRRLWLVRRSRPSTSLEREFPAAKAPPGQTDPSTFSER